MLRRDINRPQRDGQWRPDGHLVINSTAVRLYKKTTIIHDDCVFIVDQTGIYCEELYNTSFNFPSLTASCHQKLHQTLEHFTLVQTITDYYAFRLTTGIK